MWRNEKKCVFVLNIGDYAPEITAITYPNLIHYATRIDASFYRITERKFPGWPLCYEKLQIYQLAQDMNLDWIIYVDSDALIHPDTPDFTAHLPRNSVAHVLADMASVRWKYDRFFKRDGRNIGSANWFTVCSDLGIDLFRPLDDMTMEEAIGNIYPTWREGNHGVDQKHLLDDYVLSRNIAKYGLKFITLISLLTQLGMPTNFWHHQYTWNNEEKLQMIVAKHRDWERIAKLHDGEEGFLARK